MSGSTPAVVAVTGMHRSGTSLVAGLLRAAGLPMGETLLGASASNPHGHHEDTAFVELHDRALAALGADWTLAGAPASMAWTADIARDADALVAARRRDAAWGWKDPRSVLFLDEWAARIPSLRVIVVFRDAAQVAASLRRRRDPPLVHRFHGAWPLRRLGFPMTRDGRILGMWCRSNEAALAFAARRPGQCAFVDAERLRESWAPLCAWLGAGIAAERVDLDAHIDGSLFRTKAPLDLVLRAKAPHVRRIAAQLRAAAIA